jgi:biopolymer transport protein ExbD
MAGGGEAEDNPVNINVVPMVDVIFCLCVFFMCSFKFKELEGQFKAWLPKDKGSVSAPMQEVNDIRIALFWDQGKQQVLRQYGSNYIETNEEMQTIIQGAHEDAVRAGKGDRPVIIDAQFEVPWEEVITVFNICKRLSIDNIEFAMGAANTSQAQ